MAWRIDVSGFLCRRDHEFTTVQKDFDHPRPFLLPESCGVWRGVSVLCSLLPFEQRIGSERPCFCTQGGTIFNCIDGISYWTLAFHPTRPLRSSYAIPVDRDIRHSDGNGVSVKDWAYIREETERKIAWMTSSREKETYRRIPHQIPPFFFQELRCLFCLYLFLPSSLLCL